jgi:hypothetical protein
MIRKWIATNYYLPEEGQKIYYFSPQVGIFRGEFHVIPSSFANPNKFSSNHGVLDADDVPYWMPYDHGLKDMIPLPPDYKNNCDEVSIPVNSVDFTYYSTLD